MHFLKDILNSANIQKSLIKDFLEFKYFLNQNNKSLDIIFSIRHEDITMVDFQSFLDGFIHHLQFTSKMVSFIYPGFTFDQKGYETNFPIQFCYKNTDKLEAVFEKIKASEGYQAFFWMKRKEKHFTFEQAQIIITKTSGDIEDIANAEILEQIQIDITDI